MVQARTTATTHKKKQHELLAPDEQKSGGQFARGKLMWQRGPTIRATHEKIKKSKQFSKKNHSLAKKERKSKQPAKQELLRL